MLAYTTEVKDTSIDSLKLKISDFDRYTVQTAIHRYMRAKGASNPEFPGHKTTNPGKQTINPTMIYKPEKFIAPIL